MSVEKDSDLKKKDSKKETYIKQLEELGISAKGLSEEELLSKVITELNKTNSQLAASRATTEMSKLDKYVLGISHKIKNKELVLRIMNLGIPSFYLHLFYDEDAEKSDAEIWHIVNKSGINPFRETKDLFTQNKNFSPTKVKTRRIED